MAKTTIGSILFFTAATVLSQTTPATKPSFEVASIKPAAPGITRRFITSTPSGMFIATNYPLKGLVAYAYSARSFQMVGGTGWMENDGWEVEARAPSDDIPSQRELGDVTHPTKMGLMVQSLLEERFKLKAHRETRELPVYELVVAGGGSKVKLSDDQSPPVQESTPPERTSEGLPRLKRGSWSIRGSSTGREFNSLAIPFSSFVNMLVNDIGHPVIDKTGLEGLYDIQMKWAPNTPTPPGSEPPTEPYIFTAITEQLGLRLVSTKGPVDVVVIESAEKPTPN
jgi:uncharacterized protein (TIGR03435 family)